MIKNMVDQLSECITNRLAILLRDRLTIQLIHTYIKQLHDQLSEKTQLFCLTNY